jgi:hypothetical protein
LAKKLRRVPARTILGAELAAGTTRTSSPVPARDTATERAGVYRDLPQPFVER